MKVEDIKVFVPSKDYDLSKLFYKAIGFNLVFESSDLCEFENGDCSFFLQNFYNEELASNLMIQLVVADIDKTFTKLKSMDKFKVKYEPPKKTQWGRVLYLWGPSGELWHITQF